MEFCEICKISLALKILIINTGMNKTDCYSQSVKFY
jgi:hypothetical protein